MKHYLYNWQKQNVCALKIDWIVNLAFLKIKYLSKIYELDDRSFHEIKINTLSFFIQEN